MAFSTVQYHKSKYASKILQPSYQTHPNPPNYAKNKDIHYNRGHKTLKTPLSLPFLPKFPAIAPILHIILISLKNNTGGSLCYDNDIW